MPADLKDWLWRLDCLEREIRRCIPPADHFLFTIKMGTKGPLWGDREDEFFPYGEFDGIGRPHEVPVYMDRSASTDALLVDLRAYNVPVILRLDEWGFNPFPTVSSVDYLPGNLVGDEAKAWWALWDYRTEGTPKESYADALSSYDLLTRVQKTISLGPTSRSKVLYEVSQLNWHYALLYLAMLNVHAALSVRAEGLPTTVEFETFHSKDSAAIIFSHGIQEATCLAFQALRRIVVRDTAQEAKQGGAPAVAQTGPATERRPMSVAQRTGEDDFNWMECETSDFWRFSPRDVLDLIYDYRQFVQDLRETTDIEFYTYVVRAELFLCMACVEQGLDDKPIRDITKLLACELQEKGVLDPGEVGRALEDDQQFQRGWALAKVQIENRCWDCLESLSVAYRLAESAEKSKARQTDKSGGGLDRKEPPEPTGTGEPAGEGAAREVSDDSRLSPAELASVFGVPLEPLRKRLERLRQSDLTCFVEVADRSSKEPQFLYTVGKVRHIIDDLRKKASSETSGKRPARKKSH